MSCDPVYVLWSSICFVVQSLSRGPVSVLWSSFHFVVLSLSLSVVFRLVVSSIGSEIWSEVNQMSWTEIK